MKPQLPPAIISTGFVVPRLTSVPESVQIPTGLAGGSFGLAPALFHASITAPNANGTPAQRQPTVPPQPQPSAAGPSITPSAAPIANGSPDKKTVRQSPRPPSTVPAPAIPPHMQRYPAVRNTPSPSQTPRPPSAVPSAVPAHSPVIRPPSIAQNNIQAGPSMQPQQTQSPAIQAAQAPGAVAQPGQQQRPMMSYSPAMIASYNQQAQQQKKVVTALRLGSFLS